MKTLIKLFLALKSSVFMQSMKRSIDITAFNSIIPDRAHTSFYLFFAIAFTTLALALLIYFFYDERALIRLNSMLHKLRYDLYVSALNYKESNIEYYNAHMALIDTIAEFTFYLNDWNVPTSAFWEPLFIGFHKFLKIMGEDNVPEIAKSCREIENFFWWAYAGQLFN